MPRLDKLLADAGAGSRKEVRALVRAGRVSMDGQVVRAPETAVPAGAEVLLDGRPVAPAGPVWLLLYKPAGFVTSTDDPRDPTVMDLLPGDFRRRGVFPVGRLDKDTEGLLLLTTDGQAAHRLLSPRHRVDKIYYAEHTGTAGEEDIAAFRAGLVLRDGSRCLPAVLEPLGPGRSRITVQEGMYHQVRRMMAARGLPVQYLRREAEAGLTLEGLQPGQWRSLSPQEIEQVLTTPQKSAKTEESGPEKQAAGNLPEKN